MNILHVATGLCTTRINSVYIRDLCKWKKFKSLLREKNPKNYINIAQRFFCGTSSASKGTNIFQLLWFPFYQACFCQGQIAVSAVGVTFRDRDWVVKPAVPLAGALPLRVTPAPELGFAPCMLKGSFAWPCSEPVMKHQQDRNKAHNIQLSWKF